MRLLLLPLMGLVLVGEAFENFQVFPPSRPIFHNMPTQNRYMQITAAEGIMMIMGGRGMQPFAMGGRRPTSVSTHPTSFAPRRGPSIPYLPPQGQANRPSEDDQSFLTSNPGHNPSPSAVNQGHNPSSLGLAPKPSTVNDKIFFPGPKPSVSDQQHKPSGFVRDFKTPSFNPSHELSTSQELKPSSDEDHKRSSFGQDEKSFDKDEKTPMFDTLGSHPDRNPVCNVLPDPGTCRAALPRYYLDPETGTCNCYLYGGCTEDGKGESPSSFFTLEECQRECHPPKMEEGDVCKDIFKEEQFVSFLVDPLPPKNTQTDHLNDEEFLAAFYK